MIRKPINQMTPAERQEYNRYRESVRLAPKTETTVLNFTITNCSDELRDLIIAAIKNSEGK
jgi:hypothetical protein